MKQKLVILLTFLVSCIPFSSQAQRFVRKVAKTNANSLLWRISGPGMEKPSYLMGTIHMICKDDYFFTPAMDSALQHTDKLVLELDLSNPNMMGAVQSNMALPEGQTLRDFFHSDKEYADFKAGVKEIVGMDISFMEKQKPFLLISMLATAGFTCSEQTSYENNLMRKAGEKAMPIMGLETIQEQLAVFDSFDKETMRTMLLESIKENKSDKTTEQLIGLYKKQDLNGLYELMRNSSEMKGGQDALLDARNKRWAEQLPEMMKKQSLFIAVGAAHLPGNVGVLNLLQQKGYTLEPVK